MTSLENRDIIINYGFNWILNTQSELKCKQYDRYIYESDHKYDEKGLSFLSA